MSHVQHSPAARTWAASISFPRTPPRPARPASNSRTSWSAPACGTSRSARTWTAPRPAAGPAWRPPSRRNTCPITTPPAWRNRWAWTAAPTKARWSARSCWPCWAARSPSLPVRARAGVRRPHPPPHRPGRAQDRPGLRHRARRAPRGLLDLRRRTRLHHPARPLAHRRPAPRHAARGLGPALRLLVLPRDRIRHRAGHRPGA